MASGGSKLAVYSAIAINSLVAVAKLVGFGLTGSGTMLSEGLHSVADAGNQFLLAVGMKKASKPPDEKHPLGYEKEAFVWALMSAVGIFFLGCGVSVAHGIQSLTSEHHEVAGTMESLIILGIAFVLEGISCGMAVKGLFDDAKKHGKKAWQYLRTTQDPFLIAVLLEDGAAMLGVSAGLVLVVLTYVLHDPRIDAIGSILIGTLMGVLALVLIQRNRAMLVGRAAGQEERDAVQKVLREAPAVAKIVRSTITQFGADSVRVFADVDFNGSVIVDKHLSTQDFDALHRRAQDPAEFRKVLGEVGEAVVKEVGVEVDRMEDRIREVIPNVHDIHIEPH